MVRAEQTVYRIERRVAFLVTPRHPVRPDSKVEYEVKRLSNSAALGETSGQEEQVLSLSGFFYDEQLGSGISVNDAVLGKSKTRAVASLSWIEELGKKTPLWYIYSLEPPYPGAQEAKEKWGDSKLYCVALLKSNEGLVVSMCYVDSNQKERCRDKFILKAAGCSFSNSSDTVVHTLDADGNDDQAVVYSHGESRENAQTYEQAMAYDIEVGPGIDAALMALVITINDWGVGRTI